MLDSSKTSLGHKIHSRHWKSRLYGRFEDVLWHRTYFRTVLDRPESLEGQYRGNLDREGG